MPEFVRRVDAERLLAEIDARVAEIERNVIARIQERVSAGDDPQIAAAEETHRAIAQLDAESTAFGHALDALPKYSQPYLLQ